MNTHGFLGPAPASDGAQQLFAADVEGVGYVSWIKVRELEVV